MNPSTELLPPTSIRTSYSACLSLFKQFLLHLSREDCRAVRLQQVSLSEILDEFGRFKIWGEQARAARPENMHGSLDNSLRHDPETKSIVMGTLQLLCDDLERAIPIAKRLYADSELSDQDSLSSVSADSSSYSDNEQEIQPRQSKLEVLVSQIFEHVRSLYHLSMLLRRPTVRDKFIRSVEKNREDSWLQFFVAFDCNHVAEKIRQWETSVDQQLTPEEESEATIDALQNRLDAGNDSPDDVVVVSRRLGKANTRRREQLQHWVEHPDRPYGTFIDSSVASLANMHKSKPIALDFKPDHDSGSQVSTAKPGKSETQSKTLGPSTTLKQSYSTVAQSVLDDDKTFSGQARTVYEPSAVGGTEAIRVPDPPQLAPKSNTFKCSYCYSNLDARLMQNRLTWKRHVFRDLRPYVCTFARCQNPEKLYVTRHDWMYHETQMHRRQWVCAAECNQKFKFREHLRLHLEQSHADSFTSSQLPVLIDMCERSVNEDEITKCPLCPTALPLPKLQAHLASHLEEIALFVLPIEQHDTSEMDSNKVIISKTNSKGENDLDSLNNLDDEPELIKRKDIVKDLIDTEHAFVQDMRVIGDIYKGTSSTCPDLTDEDIGVLFGNLDNDMIFWVTLLDELKSAAKSIYIMPTSRSKSSPYDDLSAKGRDRLTSIGEVFQKNMIQLEKVYVHSLKNAESTRKKLQEIQRSEKVQIWLKECRQWSSDLTDKTDLELLLLRPVRKLPEYVHLLTNLLEVTPNDHPDYDALGPALRELKELETSVNTKRERAGTVERILEDRKAKESDSRVRILDTFRFRSENSNKKELDFEDLQHNAIEEKFRSNFFQLRIVIRDIEMYIFDVQTYMNKFSDVVHSFELFIGVGHSTNSEMEKKWRRFGRSIREISATALKEHISSIRNSVLELMNTLLKVYGGPQKVMSEQKKRRLDYAQFLWTKGRGKTPKKAIEERGTQFLALNETLKEELPRLFCLADTLVCTCLDNFVQIQITWLNVWRKMLGSVIDGAPTDLNSITEGWSHAFSYSEALALSLGICNGSILADAENLVRFVSPSSSISGHHGQSSPTQDFKPPSPGQNLLTPSSPQHSPAASSVASPPLRHPSPPSPNQQKPVGAPAIPQPTVGRFHPAGHPDSIYNRMRVQRSSTGEEPQPQLPQSTDSSSCSPARPPPHVAHRKIPSSELAADGKLLGRESLDRRQRRTSFFSSAMPRSDSPIEPNPPNVDEEEAAAEPKFLFLVASVYEFSIDSDRAEAGYPYLTYVAGEIFEIFGEKGELWLARNQDDPTGAIGWIWNKNFAKLKAGPETL